MWLFGCLIYEIYNGAFSKIEQIKTKGKIPESLFGYVCARRPRTGVGHAQAPGTQRSSADLRA